MTAVFPVLPRSRTVTTDDGTRRWSRGASLAALVGLTGALLLGNGASASASASASGSVSASRSASASAPASQGDPSVAAATGSDIQGPAPQPQVKRVLSKIHTDAVATYFDDGRIVLDSKADVPEALGTRFDADTVLFNIEPEALVEGGVPAIPEFSFLGEPGSPLWLAPLVQNPNVLWPGFSTEDPRLAGQLDGNSVNYELVSSVGPGKVEVYQTDSLNRPQRWFSSSERLAPVTFSVPQHAHANWAFGAEGRYELTFTASATVGGVVQRSTQMYVFHVGDIAKVALGTEVALSSASESAAAGGVRLTASVRTPKTSTPYTPSGWIEVYRGDAATADPVTLGGFERLATVAVEEGRIGLDTVPPTTGQPVYVARFVPSWSNEFSGSTSSVFRVLNADASPIPFDRLGERGSGVDLSPSSGVSAGQAVTVSVPRLGPGEYVSSWLYIDRAAPIWLGWAQLGADRTYVARVPQSAPPGTYRLAVKSVDEALIGWDDVTVLAPVVTPPLPEPPQPGAPAPEQPGSAGPDVAPPPSSVAQACAPSVVLDRGHIDAFNVTARDGNLLLQLKEDVTGSHVIREPESVLLRVKESAYQGNIPGNFPGAPSGYVLPLTQAPNLIWPGWDTNGTTGSGYTDVSITVSNVAGPGRVSLYTLAGFGSVSSVLESGGYSLPGTIREPKPVHTHAQWTFSARGIYKFTVSAVAVNPATGQTIKSAARTYVFQVGNVDIGSAFCGVGTGDTSVAGAGATLPLTDAQKAAVDAEKRAAEEAARAAEQADAPPENADRSGSHRSKSEAAGGSAFENILEGSAPPLLYAVLAGGVLILLSIAAGTVWIVRRRASDPPA